MKVFSILSRVRGELLQFVDGIVEADDRGFSGGAHDGLRDYDAGLADLREHGVDARAGFHQDHEREGITTHIEMQDVLRDAVVGNAKVFGVQSVDHLAFGVAHGDGSIDERDADADLCLRRGLLDCDARLRRDRPGRGLRGQRARRGRP